MPIASLLRLFARRALFVGAGFLVTLATALAQTPSAADGFNPDVDGVVFVLLTQPDGKLLVGGQFTTVQGQARNNLARLNVDGTVDAAFNPNANGPVRALLVQADNRIVVGGDFSTLQPNATGAAATRNRLARVNADGTLDTGFNPNLGGILKAQVFALALQPNGQIVAGGSFTTTQPNGSATAVTRNYLARFNTDGALDAAYNPNPNSIVLALLPHVDNKVVVGGGFTSFKANGETNATTRNRLARLNPNGTLDSEFDPNVSDGVTTLAVQRDGKIVLGGFFTTMQPYGDESVANRVHLARLNPSGSLDSEFYPRVEGDVRSVAVQVDGSILVGGTFASVWGLGSTGAARANVARFLADGTIDDGFAPTLNGPVEAVVALPDGKVVVGGQFTRALPQGGTTPLVRNHLARLNPDGSIDANFELDAGGRTMVAVTQADGKVVIGGSFTSVGGTSHNYVARLNADGSVDNSYNPDFNGRVYAMALQTDGKVIVGGAFTTIGGETRQYLARLNPSGTIDSEFYPSFDGQVGTVALLSDGRILVGGSFSNVQPVGAALPLNRKNLIRLNANGTLDSAFDPEPNSSVAALGVQSDGKIVIGGSFSTVQPGGAPTVTTAANGTVTTTLSTATTYSRNFLARLNADGSLDTTFIPNPNGQVSAIVVQSDGKVVVGGVFTAFQEIPTSSTATTTPVVRNRLARINADGKLDAAYDPNANGTVITLVLQSDGKVIAGGSFTTFQPNGAADWTLRKYAGRLNTDGTVDATFNLDLSEFPGNRVDFLRLQADGRLFIGGVFTSLQPLNTAARIARKNFVRLAANGTVDTAFDAAAGGATGATVNALAVQRDGRVIAVGSFSDLGGARSTNIARFRSEGTPDSEFSAALSTDGPLNAVLVRPSGEPVATQISGFAWLNANGTLRTAFATGATRLTGEVSAALIDRNGNLLLGGTFANVSNSTGGNFVRLTSAGVIDTSFNPSPNGAVTGIIEQSDGRLVIVGSFTTVGGQTRNRIARIDANGSVDVTYDPNANGFISGAVLEADGKIVIGGSFTSFTPNLTTTAVARNYIARVNLDGTLDANYNPSPNFNVNALVAQPDGKLVIGGSFTSLSPNSSTTAVVRNYLARLNTDGTLDQNFDPSTNSTVNAIVTQPNGQLVVGGTFTTLQPGATGTVITRNNVARLNSDGTVDLAFNPNANASIASIARQADGALLIGGTFSTLQPNGAASPISRNHFARLNADGSLDLNFNPDINGSVNYVGARPDGTVLVGGRFSELQLNGSILVGGSFATIGGVSARNLAMLNDNGSVTTAFQPRPDGAVNALLALPDGKTIVGGAFTNIAGAARSRLARFNTDGSLDTAYNASAVGTVRALALQADGRVLVGGSGLVRLTAAGAADAAFAPAVTGTVTSVAVQADGKILYAINQAGLARLNADGSADTSFNAPAGGVSALTVQADGGLIVAGAPSRLVRLNANGTIDASFNPAPNGAVGAIALQADGRLMIGGGFSSVGGVTRVSIARLSATGVATQTLGVAANRGSVVLNRGGTSAEFSAVTFELSTNLSTWTRLGDGLRVPGTANWQVAGLSLPASGSFYVRARGITPSTGGTSSGMTQVQREFNFTNPLATAPGVVAQAPAQAAAPSLSLDPVTGIAPRSTLVQVADGVIEIFATQTQGAVSNSTARLSNLSTRGLVAVDSPLILGFAIAGNEPRRVLLRAVGPGLKTFGVTDALAATSLQIFDAKGVQLAGNEGWASAAELVQTAAATGAFPLAAGSADSAIVLKLAPGTYTMQVANPRGVAGIALAEIYDADTGSGSQLVNVSSRGAAGTGDAALISGFVISGGSAVDRLLLRAVGPGLAAFGTLGVVNDPVISLFDSAGRALGANDNWVSSVSDISLATSRVGAFALATGSKDAAVLATLPSGAYTIQVTGTNNGTALLEVYVVR